MLWISEIGIDNVRVITINNAHWDILSQYKIIIYVDLTGLLSRKTSQTWSEEQGKTLFFSTIFHEISDVKFFFEIINVIL